jgi:UDP-N-acetylmuramoyl-L-alanyl-D-glutamate--2,6-diaminopimelate ligase
MKLRELLADVDVEQLTGPAGAEGMDVSAVAYNSREVQPGGVFVAIRGEKTDGNNFVTDAISRGAMTIVSELPFGSAPAGSSDGSPAGRLPAAANTSWAQVKNARRALATIAANFYGRPARALKLIGITGTNGKTTTSYLIDSILRAAGLETGLAGTIEYRTPRGTLAAKSTTPESLDLQKFFAEVRGAGGTHAVMEVSSHALAMERAWGCPFAVAVFTNLTRDHLDFHKTMEEYAAAKRRLFEGTGAGAPHVAVINSDDAFAAQLKVFAPRTLTYGLRNGAEVTTKKFALTFSGLEFTAHTPAGKIEIVSPLVGRINVYNILAAVGAALVLDVPREAIAEGILDLKNVPGRFERIDEGQPFLVVVDYAHTDDALRNLLETARELVRQENRRGRIITLFGCGGDRDRTKRPLMGEAAGALSDLVVLTSDNPRSEDPRLIINDAVVGLQRANARYVIEADRARAIEIALDAAEPGDIVLLAGKGHETYQILREQTIHFDDREQARAALRKRGYGV